uniref:FtsX-like permease family protein n=1 Tax=Candidatus Kentrum sp. LFY TaxID=2126342 RepID=A0A450UUG7_9GAMM|nr:MAG: hypothetical protein BECKLFY1418B_GA0070995_10814 [Candidatus Kentron sp. LFY]
MSPFFRIAKLFVRELFWGLRNGAQHRYLVSGLTLGLTLLLLLAIGLSVLHIRVYDTILGRAGGPRVWMDSPTPLSTTQDGLHLEDGRPLRIYPYTDITQKTLAFPGKRTRDLRGRLIPTDHPLRKVLQPVVGARTVLNSGFLHDPEAPSPSPSNDSALLSESRQAILYLGLRALPAIDWQAQIERASALLKPDYRILHELAGDCHFSAALRTPGGVAHLYGKGDEPDMARECGESPSNYREAFSDWQRRLAAGGNETSGLFLANGDWIRVVWVREIPLPGGFDYLMDFEFGQALKLRSRGNEDTSVICRINPGSRYDEVYVRSDIEPLLPVELYFCLDPCFEEGHPGCRVEDTPYGEQKITGPHLYPAWLMACPALANRLSHLSPGNQSPTMDRACVGSGVYEMDVYLPDYGVLPEAERFLKEKWGMRPGPEARDALVRISELVDTLDGLAQIGQVALLVYLCVVLLSLQDNLARRRQGALGQLRAHGFGVRYILVGGMVADVVSWSLSVALALAIACVTTVIFLGIGQIWGHYLEGIIGAWIWLAISLLLHVSASAAIHWWRVLRVDPGRNLDAVD